MTTHPETSAILAAELVRTRFSSGTVSSPDTNARAKHPDGRVQTDAPAAILAASSKKIRLRRITGGEEYLVQAEFFIARQTFHRNMSEQEIITLLDLCFSGLFSRGTFSASDGVRSVMVSKKGALSIILAPGKLAPPSETEYRNLSHDRIKRRIIPEGSPVPFLVDLGVMAADGSVYKSKYPKYRQINRFLEFVADILPELRKASGENPGEPLRVVDFGCGKSYLTFALYHYLHHIENFPVSITGLDLKQDVIDRCSLLARTCGYDGLSFAVGDIAGYTESAAIDMVVSLHACDTATDLAIAQAIRWNTPVILAVPCCQHELNTQLAPGSVRNEALRPITPLLRHGIIRERFSALLTDTLRAELLESCGYRVQLVEFIDMSHTPKNILIRAIREKKSDTRTDNCRRPSRSFRELADFFGVQQTLETELYGDTTGETSAGKD